MQALHSWAVQPEQQLNGSRSPTDDWVWRVTSTPNLVTPGNALTSITRALPFDFAESKLGHALRSFFRSCHVLRVLMCAVTVQRWTDAEKELEGIAETIAIIAIESLGAIVDGELRAEADVETVTM